MYFWNIEKLKQQLAQGPLSERETLSYLLAFSIVITLSMWGNGEWVWWQALLEVVLAVAGTLYVYRRNGGDGGEHFLQRYMTVGWVVGIRYTVPFMLLLIGGFAVAAVAGVLEQIDEWVYALITTLFSLLLYWRIGHHIGDVVARRAA